MVRRGVLGPVFNNCPSHTGNFWQKEDLERPRAWLVGEGYLSEVCQKWSEPSSYLSQAQVELIFKDMEKKVSESRFSCNLSGQCVHTKGWQPRAPGDRHRARSRAHVGRRVPLKRGRAGCHPSCHGRICDLQDSHWHDERHGEEHEHWGKENASEYCHGNTHQFISQGES